MSKDLIRLGYVGAVVALAFVVFASTSAVFADEAEPNAEEEKEINYKELENPIPFTKASIGRGRVIFKRMCTECHGPDGKGQMDVIADASDLTSPKRYYNGSTVGEVYRSIRNGAGTNMPAFLDQLKKEEDLWHLTNFVVSLWPEDLQPELVEPEKQEKEDATGDGE